MREKGKEQHGKTEKIKVQYLACYDYKNLSYILYFLWVRIFSTPNLVYLYYYTFESVIKLIMMQTNENFKLQYY